MPICDETTDDRQTSAERLAIEQARRSATFRRPTKELERNVAGGRNAVPAPGAMAVEVARAGFDARR